MPGGVGDAIPRFTFVQRFPNGGYNPQAGAQQGVYSNPSMPNFVPAGANGISGGGRSTYYDVVDGGCNTFNGQNTAGGSGSGSTTPYFKSAGAQGQVVGQIVWDAVMARWTFVMKEAHTDFLPDTVDGQSDANQIKNFINSISGSGANIALGGNPPTSDQVGSATDVNLGGAQPR